MILGSHNSLTYLKSVKFWMKPFKWMAQCQDLDLISQYNNGVRLFDVRVWGFKNSFVEYNVCHGFFAFKTNLEVVFSLLENLAEKNNEDIWCRLWLEENNVRKHYKDISVREQNFINFCYYIQLKFSHIKFFGGLRKFDGKELFKFNNDTPLTIDKYSSVTSIFDKNDGPGNFTKLRYLDDLYPRLYAKKYNKDNMKMYKENSWVRDYDINQQNNGGILFMDFVGKYI